MKRNQTPGKSPGFWWYPADFERDVQMLSLAAQGLWMRMLGWMHQNEAHRGYLELPTGEPMTNSDIAARAGKPVREVVAALQEMVRVGVYSVDDRRCIFSRRMARETHISRVRREAADARWNAATCIDNAYANGEAKNMQNPAVSDSVSDSDSSETPPLPPRMQADRFDFEAGFGAVWQAYPSKGRTKIADSQRQYVEAVSPDPIRTHLAIMAGITGKWAASDNWARGFVCSLSEFLRNRRWLEDPEPYREKPHPDRGNGGGSGGRGGAVEAAIKALHEVDLSDVETAY